MALEQTDEIVVRRLTPRDLDAVISVDAKTTGRRRDEFFKLKLKQALSDTGIEVSLAAEVERLLVGFLLARVYYGEYGLVEPVAVLDTIDVLPDFRSRGVGSSLLAQLCMNLKGLGIQKLQTEVSWDMPELMTFFQREGFVPAQRFCLDLDLDAPRPGDADLD